MYVHIYPSVCVSVVNSILFEKIYDEWFVLKFMKIE